MAANTPVGNVQTVYLQTYDQLGNQYETNINGNNFQVKSTATYQEVDGAMRALNTLTNNVYRDTLLITAVSVNQEMEEQPEP